MHVYIYIPLYMYTYLLTYIYIHTHREREIGIDVDINIYNDDCGLIASDVGCLWYSSCYLCLIYIDKLLVHEALSY